MYLAQVLLQGLDPATCQAITGGDSRCVAIAAASILAKVMQQARSPSAWHSEHCCLARVT